MKHNVSMRCSSWLRWASVLIATAVVLTGCKKKAEPVFGQVEKGMEIPLMLIREIQAGADAVGTPVPYLVTQDVVDAQGNIVIRKGAVAYGKVVKSRSESTLSALVNQPARLEVTVFKVIAADGTEIAVSAVKDGEPTAPFELNRANTGIPEGAGSLDAAWDKSETQKDLVMLAQLIENSKNSDLAANPATADLLKKLAGELDLRSTSQLSGGRDTDEVARLLGQISVGSTDLGAIGQASLGQVSALIELTKVVGYVGNRLGDALKGRTIRAHVGTPFRAFVQEEATVRIPVPAET